jgi:hypothetical protein
MYIGVHVKYLLFLSYLSETIILDRFSKNTQVTYSTKICPVELELLHADRHNKANSCFLEFCERA